MGGESHKINASTGRAMGNDQKVGKIDDDKKEANLCLKILRLGHIFSKMEPFGGKNKISGNYRATFNSHIRENLKVKHKIISYRESRDESSSN